MRLCRFGAPGEERPGLLDALGELRSLESHVPDITPRVLAPDSLERLRALDPSRLPRVPGAPRLGVPVQGIGKFLGIGLNYADHAAEVNLPPPSEPIFFTKAVSCLNGPDDDIVIPRDSVKTDWEVELGVVIGTRCRYVEESAALSHVAGYVLVNDVSEREFQKERGSQWDKGKGCDTFGPCGPWLVTSDDVEDPQRLDMYLDMNGQRMQQGNTSTMIFGVRELIAYVSRFVTLEPGDLITTGTPPGVGESRKPGPVFLRPGDRMRLGIRGLGEQNQRVVAFR